MHTVLNRSDKWHVVFVSTNGADTIFVADSRLQAMVMASWLNGGKPPVAEMIEPRFSDDPCLEHWRRNDDGDENISPSAGGVTAEGPATSTIKKGQVP